MQDSPNSFDAPMKSMGRAEWFSALAEIGQDNGYFEQLGASHAAVFIEEEATLLVTFESRQGIQALSDTGQPLGFDMVKATGWSHLGLICDGETWFRDREVYAFFDQLDEDGFFDDFDRVVFYGAGPCGYAAAAFARAAQDATVVAIQPQATLDPRLANWDERFIEHRMTDFSGDYGYAPEFLEMTEQTFVVFDPRETLDAMHAALFKSPKTTMLRTPFLGAALQPALLEMSLLYRILARAGSGRLTDAWFHKMMRLRRDYPPYLRNLLAVLERDQREELIEALCLNVTGRMQAPRFERKLAALREH
ncbi:phosphoadenosine phosphosulfate reductase [Roseobacteraceae bacterium S113]